MSCDNPAIHRITRLEKSNRRLRSAVIGLAVAGLSVWLLGAAGPPMRQVKAQQFVLVDSNNNTTATLSTTSKGASLTFAAGDQNRPGLSILGDVVSGNIYVVDPVGNTRVVIVAKANTTSLGLLNPDGTLAVGMGSSGDINGIVVNDETGNRRIGATTERNGTAAFSLRKSSSTADIASLSDSVTGSVFKVQDANGKNRIILGVPANDSPSLGITDDGGVLRALVRDGTMTTFDKFGKSLWTSASSSKTSEK